MQKERSLALGKILECLLKQGTSSWSGQNQSLSNSKSMSTFESRTTHVSSNEEINFTLLYQLPKFFFFSSGLQGVHKPLEIAWKYVYVHIYLFTGSRVAFISKGCVTINKLKNVLGFCENLVLFSVIGRRVLKVIIKCSISTEAGTTHSPLENNFSEVKESQGEIMEPLEF